jgi:hypothetical protein
LTAFLAELSSKLADKWISLLVAPGFLFLAVAFGGGDVLGQRHSYDLARLEARLRELANSHHSGFAIAVALTGTLAGAAAVGLVAEGIARFLGWLWTGAWRGPFVYAGKPLVAERRWRWDRAERRRWNAVTAKADRMLLREEGVNVAGPDPDPAAMAARRNRIGIVRPERPTWIGDRLLAVDTRVFSAYALDLSFGWPRLWMALPDAPRSDLTAARAAYDSASRLASWGLLYIVLGGWWWPAALAGAAVVVAGWIRARYSTAAYADLLESSVDLFGKDLANSLGIPGQGLLTRQMGRAITGIVRKGS